MTGDPTPPPRRLRGLEKICKCYGRMPCGDVLLAWDYARERAMPEKELRANRELWAASEKARHAFLRSSQD